MALNADRRYQLADHVLAQDMGTQLILLDAQRQNYYSGNAVARCVFSAIRDGLSESEILRRLLQEFSAGEGEVSADLRACLDDWLAQGLIRIRDEAAIDRG
jgi:Coenzyme PQQ synthesis protein D (PqqD)